MDIGAPRAYCNGFHLVAIQRGLGEARAFLYLVTHRLEAYKRPSTQWSTSFSTSTPLFPYYLDYSAFFVLSRF